MNVFESQQEVEAIGHYLGLDTCGFPNPFAAVDWQETEEKHQKIAAL